MKRHIKQKMTLISFCCSICVFFLLIYLSQLETQNFDSQCCLSLFALSIKCQ